MHRLLAASGCEAVGLDGGGDGRRLQSLWIDWADNPQVITRGQQIGGDHAGHGERLLRGFMGITITQRQVAMGSGGHHDHPVGSRRAVGYTVRAVGAEDARGESLTFPDWTAVV